MDLEVVQAAGPAAYLGACPAAPVADLGRIPAAVHLAPVVVLGAVLAAFLGVSPLAVLVGLRSVVAADMGLAPDSGQSSAVTAAQVAAVVQLEVAAEEQVSRSNNQAYPVRYPFHVHDSS